MALVFPYELYDGVFEGLIFLYFVEDVVVVFRKSISLSEIEEDGGGIGLYFVVNCLKTIDNINYY